MTFDLQPSEAERARTVLTHAATMTVELLGRGVLETIDRTGIDDDGSLVALVGLNSTLADGVADHPAPCRLEAALVSPLPGADRVLDRVSAVGHLWLEPDVSAGMEVLSAARGGVPQLPGQDGAVLLRMSFSAINLDGCPVSPAAYAMAEADPMAAGSAAFVEHLGRSHAAEVIQLAHLLSAEVTRDVRAVTPISVDRFGLTVRLHHGVGSTCVRLNFDSVLRDPKELPRAMVALQIRAATVQTCPFTNRPRDTAPPG